MERVTKGGWERKRERECVGGVCVYVCVELIYRGSEKVSGWISNYRDSENDSGWISIYRGSENDSGWISNIEVEV